MFKTKLETNRKYHFSVAVVETLLKLVCGNLVIYIILTSCAVTLDFQRVSAMQNLRFGPNWKLFQPTETCDYKWLHAESVSKPGACVVYVCFRMQNPLTCGKLNNTLCKYWKLCVYTNKKSLSSVLMSQK